MRRSIWVAWALLAVWTASVAVLVTLSVANGNFQQDPLANTVGLLLAFAAFMGVGTLIVANRPGNAIGWIFSAVGLLPITGALAATVNILIDVAHKALDPRVNI